VGPIAIGTSSWSFDGWRDVFYPEGLARAEWLRFYSRRFPTVEVNTSFYGLPDVRTLVNWVASVPVGFTFALKFPRAVSHEKRLAGSDAETLEFLEVLRTLGPAAAPAFLQLPPDFNRQRYGRTLASYLDWLASLTSGLRIGVEVRAADLMTESFAGFLAERGFALVLVDRKATPDLFELWQAARGEVDFVSVRWIGDDRGHRGDDRAIITPRDSALDCWAGRLAGLSQAGVAVFGYMHNPYEGHSPASVARLLERLAVLTPLPAWPPIDTTGDSANGGGQLPLL
jgi:uncharacterized protein YecE (DUF72 family)